MHELISLHNRVTPLNVYYQGAKEQGETIDLDFIDEIYFSSPACVRNFKSCYQTIPETIAVTTPDQKTEAEYKKLLMNNVSPKE